MKYLEKFGFVKVEYCDIKENTLNNRNEIGGDNNMVKLCGIKDCFMVNGIKVDSVDVGFVKICYDGYND